MFSIFVLVFILCVITNHNVADYMFQKGSWAETKFENDIALTKHVLLYVILWIPMTWLIWFIVYDHKVWLFLPITFILHWVQDYVTSKWTHELAHKKNWGSDELPRTWDFFVVLAYDQVIHYIQLFTTFYLLTSWK